MTMRFDDRVVVVTGAGRGLGRSYALLLARRGAKVIVNNRTSADGRVDSAAEVVDRIRSEGGAAVPERSDLTHPSSAQELVELSLATWGRLDAVVHNAGVIESRNIADSSELDLVRIYESNTMSAFRLTQAALPVMRRQHYGRFVFSTSTAGLYGNAGLAAYSMAKGALLGLMRAVAFEEAENGILANAICPTAVTRMTSDFVRSEAMRDALAPRHVAPAVAWLAGDQCSRSGLVILAAGGLFRSSHTLQNAGVDLRAEGDIEPEHVAAAVEEITDARGLRGFEEAGSHFSALLEELEQDPSAARR